MDPDEMIAEFCFDEAINFIQGLFKTRCTEFAYHLPFVKPSEVTAALPTGTFAVFLGGLLKHLPRFARLLNLRQQSNCIGFLAQ